MRPSSNAKTAIQELSAYSRDRLIAATLYTAHELNLPIAIWRLPNRSEINLIVSLEGSRSLTKVDLEELPSGFVFAPFDFGDKPAQFIQADFSLSFDFEEVIENRNVVSKGHDDPLREFKNRFMAVLDNSDIVPKYHFNQKHSQQNTTDYKALVALSVNAIKEGSFEKVVPARSKSIPLDKTFNPVDLILGLVSEYPRAFVSCVSMPDKGTWIGATPEVLIEKSGDSFKTVALAGTQHFNTDKDMSETAWTQKEIEEQAMVSRYIINCFKKIRLREYTEIGPRTAKAGNLLHLKTTYEVDTNATNFPELATTMLELLHPTSAVAGMPKENVMPFLKKHEGLDRSFFSGFLGPVSIEDASSLFVNLRCMQLLQHQAILYAGAGVTADSNPSKEFQETEIKFNTLLNVLNKPA